MKLLDLFLKTIHLNLFHLKNLVDQIWARKNYSSNKSFFWLSKKFTGQSNEQKLSKVYKNLKKEELIFSLSLQVKIMLGYLI